MALFVYLEVSCFLLCQVAATALVLKEFGSSIIPWMFALAGVASLPGVYIAHQIGEKYYQSLVVYYGLIVTAVTFLSLRVLLYFAGEYTKIVSIIFFTTTEVFNAYFIDQYWVLIEESVNILQAKKLFNYINYGSAIAGGVVGACLYMIPWADYIVPADLIYFAVVLVSLDLPLVYIIQPKTIKTAANAAKDRRKLEKRQERKKAREVKRKSKAAGKDPLKDGLLAGANAMIFLDDSEQNEELHKFLQLARDPMLPALGGVICLTWIQDTVYQWQFIALLEGKLIDRGIEIENLDSQVAKYIGLMQVATVVLQLPLVNLTRMLMQRFGLFACITLMPIVNMAVSVLYYLSENAESVVMARGLYMCFFQLNFGWMRVMWLAVPENMKNYAHAVLNDVQPGVVRGIVGLATVFIAAMIHKEGASGLATSSLSELITIVMVIGGFVWLLVLKGLERGYMYHLENSLNRRQFGLGDFYFDTNNMVIVRYIEKMLTMGDYNQQLFILRLLQNVDLERFVPLLHGLYVEDTPVVMKQRLIDLGRSDPRVVPDSELLRIVARGDPVFNRPGTTGYIPDSIVAASVVACGHRGFKDVRKHARKLLDDERHHISVEVRMSAAIALLCFKPSPKWREKIEQTIKNCLSLQASFSDRVVALEILSNFFDERVHRDDSPTTGNMAGRRGKIIGLDSDTAARQPHPTSPKIISTGLGSLLPLVAQNMTDPLTWDEAAKTIAYFGSSVVQEFFERRLSDHSNFDYFQPSVFKFLVENSKRVNDNKIVTILLEHSFLQHHDSFESEAAAMTMRAVVAISRAVGLNMKHQRMIRSMLGSDIHLAYKKFCVLHWLDDMPFSYTLTSFVSKQLKLTCDRILVLLACLLPLEPVDEYAEKILYSEDGDQFASAYELLEACTPRELWMRIGPLLDHEIKPADRVQLANKFFRDLADGVDDALEEYLLSSSELFPAFILDFCKKNEFGDFLNSLDWSKVFQKVREQCNDSRGSGRFSSGAHLMLEIVVRDSHANRALLRSKKRETLMRFGKLNRNRDKMSTRDAKNRRKNGKKGLKESLLGKGKSKSKSSSDDDSASRDEEMRMMESMGVSFDGEDDTVTKGSLKSRKRKKQKKNKRREIYDELESQHARKKAVLSVAARKQRDRERKQKMAHDIRFNLDCCGYDTTNPLSGGALLSEQERLQLLRSQVHAENLALDLAVTKEALGDQDEIILAALEDENDPKARAAQAAGKKRSRKAKIFSKRGRKNILSEAESSVHKLTLSSDSDTASADSSNPPQRPGSFVASIDKSPRSIEVDSIDRRQVSSIDVSFDDVATGTGRHGKSMKRRSKKKLLMSQLQDDVSKDLMKSRDFGVSLDPIHEGASPRGQSPINEDIPASPRASVKLAATGAKRKQQQHKFSFDKEQTEGFQEKTLYDVFIQIDMDESGTVDREEFKALADILELDLGKKELDDAFKEMDIDGGGDVDYEEFEAWFYKLSSQRTSGSKMRSK
jgi:hypothetical protein